MSTETPFIFYPWEKCIYSDLVSCFVYTYRKPLFCMLNLMDKLKSEIV